jgi:hypothetical protein
VGKAAEVTASIRNTSRRVVISGKANHTRVHLFMFRIAPARRANTKLIRSKTSQD